MTIGDLILDSRELAAELRYLESDAEELSAEEIELRDELKEAESEIADWRFGETLVREDHFEEYAKQLAEDIGAPLTADWPMCHIDWKAAADALRQDYTEITLGGYTYLARS